MLLTGVVAVLATMLASILIDPNKAYLLSKRVGLDSTGGYFHVHRRLTYEAAVWRAQQRSGQSVYLLGDSITAGLDASLISLAPLNFGVSGERVEWLSGDIDRLRVLDDAQCIVITLGVNDLAATLPVNTITENYGRLLQQLPSTTALIVGEVLPVTKNFSTNNEGASPARVRAFNEQMHKLCSSLPNCEIAPWSNSFSDTAGHGLSKYYLPDGLHLNKEGYAAWRPLIADMLMERKCH